jgi:formamidopyrimidine-DNA glycosylase
MPELPEVETIKLYLETTLKDKILKDITVLEKKQFIGNPHDAFGKKVVDVTRTGKILHIKIEDTTGSVFLNFHLKLSGQILYSKDESHAEFRNVIPRADTHKMPGKTTRIIIHFADGSTLFFNDLRKFGWIKLTEKEDKPKALDILSSDFTFSYFQKNIMGTKRPIKVVMMDQDRMAGIGNIYANDALYNAKIHPRRPASSLNLSEQKILYDAILETIKSGIKFKGSSAKDELYVMPDSTKGEYQHHFAAYHQHGKPCKRCGTIMERIELGGRGTFFCPKCQLNKM